MKVEYQSLIIGYSRNIQTISEKYFIEKGISLEKINSSKESDYFVVIAFVIIIFLALLLLL